MLAITYGLVLVLLASFLSQGNAFRSNFLSRGSMLSTLSMVSVGESAPDFDLKNYQGKSFKLSSFKGKKNVVVFFYPADNTPGCTTEVCAFQKRFPDFKALNAEVFGISSGGPADKQKFVTANKVTSYELLIDEGDKVRSAWKVPKALFGK
jgi:thioredoxin-dependent peroxiredoxin